LLSSLTRSTPNGGSTPKWFSLEAIETTPASAGVDVLIGQDLLHQVVMSWDGPRWKLLLMY
jgi:hypothetical protein